MHFHTHEILRTVEAFDPKTGTYLSHSLKKPKLKPDAIPSQFPYSPEYLSKPCTSKRVSRDEQLKRKDEESLAKALIQSQLEYEDKEKFDECSTRAELNEKLNLPQLWHTVDKQNETIICNISNNGSAIGPTIKNAVLVSDDLLLNAYCDSKKLPLIGEFHLPLKVKKVSTVLQVCDAVTALTSANVDGQTDTAGIDAVCLLQLNLILALLLLFKSEKCSFHSVISFVYEQLTLLTKQKKSYSHDFLIFSSIFYNISPHAYRFSRSSGNCILPCYSTIKKLTCGNFMDPFYEQTENTFLYYIKQKFKGLNSQDVTVCLSLDEIHLKPFFDYKGGNVAGAAFNSTEAANSAFVFMITSVFSLYKDVAHVLPSCKMSGNTLFEMIGKTIIL